MSRNYFVAITLSKLSSPGCCVRPLAWGPPQGGVFSRARVVSPGAAVLPPRLVATPYRRCAAQRARSVVVWSLACLAGGGWCPPVVGRRPHPGAHFWFFWPSRRRARSRALSWVAAREHRETQQNTGPRESPGGSDVRSQKSREGVKTGPDHPKKHGGEPGPPPRKASPRMGEAAFGRGRWNRGSVRRERPRPKSWPDCRWGCDERPPSHN